MRKRHGLLRRLPGRAAGLPRGRRARHVHGRGGRTRLHPVRGLPPDRLDRACGPGAVARTPPRRRPADPRLPTRTPERGARARSDRRDCSRARRVAGRRWHGPARLVPHCRGSYVAASNGFSAANTSRHHADHPRRLNSCSGPSVASGHDRPRPHRFSSTVPCPRHRNPSSGTGNSCRASPPSSSPRLSSLGCLGIGDHRGPPRRTLDHAAPRATTNSWASGPASTSAR